MRSSPYRRPSLVEQKASICVTLEHPIPLLKECLFCPRHPSAKLGWLQLGGNLFVFQIGALIPSFFFLFSRLFSWLGNVPINKPRCRPFAAEDSFKSSLPPESHLCWGGTTAKEEKGDLHFQCNPPRRNFSVLQKKTGDHSLFPPLLWNRRYSFAPVS